MVSTKIRGRPTAPRYPPSTRNAVMRPHCILPYNAVFPKGSATWAFLHRVASVDPSRSFYTQPGRCAWPTSRRNRTCVTRCS